jgi:hypothetical protein
VLEGACWDSVRFVQPYLFLRAYNHNRNHALSTMTEICTYSHGTRSDFDFDFDLDPDLCADADRGGVRLRGRVRGWWGGFYVFCGFWGDSRNGGGRVIWLVGHHGYYT